MTTGSGKSFESDAYALASRLGASEPKLIAKGTEAHVYGLDNERVLKIYPSPEALPGIEALHEFYERTSTANIGYAIPHIREHGQAGSVVYSVEDRLAGVPMADIAGFIGKSHVAELYIDAVLGVRQILVSPPYRRRKLFGPDEGTGDWNGYVRSEIASKSQALRLALPTEVFAKLGPVDALTEYFTIPYTGEDRLIHGDFHPGNILLIGEDRVSAVVDFGTFTMFGDPLYDIATACGYFSMYEPDQLATRKRVLERLFAKDATLDPVRIHAYLLAAALLTCDLYPDEGIPAFKTGHFDWALSVLGDSEMWTGITN